MRRVTRGAHFVVVGICSICFSGVAGALTLTGPQFEVGNTVGYSDNWHNFDTDVGGGKYAIVWMDASAQIKVTLVPTGGTSAAGTYVLNTGLTGVTYQGAPSVAWDGVDGKFGVVWMVGNDVNSFKLYYNTVTTGGTVGAYKQLALSSTNYHAPDLIWDGSRFVVAYSTYGGSYDLRVSAFSAAGDPLAAPIVVASVPAAAMRSRAMDPQFGGPDAFNPKLAFNGSGYGLVYDSGPTNTIWYAYLNGSLAVQAGFPTRISDTTPIHSAARICLGSGGEFASVWQHSTSNLGHVYFARLTSAGMVAGPTALVTSGSDMRPDIVWDGGRYLVEWSESGAPASWETKAATFTSAGAIEGTAVQIWLAPGGASSGTRVGSHAPDNYLLVMRDANFAKIYAQNASNQLLLSASSNPPEGGTVKITPPGTSGTSVVGGPYALNDVVSVKPTATSGWSFTGWSGDATGNADPLSVTMDRAKSVVANFSNPDWPTLNLTISPNGAGTTTINGVSATSKQAAPVTPMSLVATANLGYLFNSWRDAGGVTIFSTNRAWSVAMPGTNTTYMAMFDTAYSVSTTGNPTNGGSVSPTGSLWYGAGTQVGFTATPSQGYTFANWDVNGVSAGNANPITLTIDSNKTIYANFTYGGGGTTYSLTTSASPSTGGTVAPAGTTVYASGSSVKVTATPAAGYSFSSWSGSASGSVNPVTVTMNADKNVTANFREGTGTNAPAIDSLVQTTSVLGSAASFLFNFSDADGNLPGGKVGISYKYKTRGRSYKKDKSIPRNVIVTGSTSGTIAFDIKFKQWRSSYSSFPMTITVTDGADMKGNSVTINVLKTIGTKHTVDAEGVEDPQE